MLRFYLQVYLFLMVVMLFSLVSKKNQASIHTKLLECNFNIYILQRLENLISFLQELFKSIYSCYSVNYIRLILSGKYH